MGHSSPSTQSILSSFHSNGSTTSAVSQMGSPSFNSKNGSESSFSSRSPTSENKSATTFDVTPPSTQMGKAFVAIKMATTSPKSSRCIGGGCGGGGGGGDASSTWKVPTSSLDPFCTPTKLHHAIHSLSTINATSMRRQPTSKFATPNILVPSSAPPALDRKITVDLASTSTAFVSVSIASQSSSGYTTPKCFAPLACSSYNASICGRRASIDARIVNHNCYERIQMAPSRKTTRISDASHLSTPHRPTQPSRARLSLLAKFQICQNYGPDE